MRHPKPKFKPLLRTAALASALAMAGCAVGPTYQRPAIDTPVAFKEGQGEWVRAAPADALARGPWWELFNDSDLNGLAAQVQVSNQNVAAAVASYAQARALVAQQRAALFPTVSLDASANRNGANTNSARNGS